MIAGRRFDALREGKMIEPTRCPRCGKIVAGSQCLEKFGGCGWAWQGKKAGRPVVTVDGELKYLEGPVYKKRRQYEGPNAAQLWERMYYRALSDRWDGYFKQAEARFAEENRWQWPSRDLPLMPIHDEDRYQRVSDVSADRLRGDPELLEKVKAFRRKRGLDP